jgi:serine/threonine protein kinase
MSLCINPQCPKPQNTETDLFCQGCGSELLLKGRYRTLRKLGEGGFGVTYEVVTVRSNLPQVLKVLTENSPKAVELFQQEARVLSELQNSGIPYVDRDSYFSYFCKNSSHPLHCLVMEKIVGMDLEQYMANRDSRPIEQSQAIDWLQEILGILASVHQQNFFHRDIKPSNIMIRSSGELALIDFGTARQVTGTVVNQQGGVTGIISPGYTPQEQINNYAVPQSDFFALARTFVKLLTGRYPLDFYDSYNDEIRWRQAAPDISPVLADLIDEMMAAKPNQRPATAELILQKLADIERQLYPASSTKANNPTAATSNARSSVPVTIPVRSANDFYQPNAGYGDPQQSPNAIANHPQSPVEPFTPDRSPIVNNSGCGRIFDETIPIPAEIRGWSWGGFLLTGIWSPFNLVWVGLLSWVPYLGLIVTIWMGFKGNELAWKSKRWASIEQFKKHQRNWAISGFIVTGLVFVIVFLATIIAASRS